MIAAIIPIGDLSVNGYGRVFDVCLRSISRFADLVVVVQNQEADNRLYIRGDNVRLISDPFPGGRYDGDWFNRNIATAEDYAYAMGADVFITMSSNWYIPKSSMACLRLRCESVCDWDYIYRGNQLGGDLFSASKRLPMVWRAGKGRYTFSPDGMRLPDGFITVERGDYQRFDGEMIVDVPFEVTLEELAGRLNFFRCYHDNLPKRNPVFDWGYWHDYYLAKMKDWKVSALSLGEYGREIAANTKPDYISHLFMGEYATA